MGQRDVPDFFAFYPYEFLSDERVLAMTLEQVGAYLLLIISQWINGSIPSDIPTLARILKRTTAEMEILWTGVSPCFMEHPEIPGRLIQKRVEVERVKAITAMELERERKRAYRERRKSGEVTRQSVGQDRDSPGPSTLLSSYVSSKDSKKEDVEKSDKQWGEFRRLYPEHRFDEERAYRAWLSRESDVDQILAGLRLWAESDQWKERGGKFANWASKFISEGIYLIPPPPMEQEPEAPSRYREWDGQS